MPTDLPVHDTTRPVGRTDLIAAIETALAAGSGVLLSGPDGIGKSTVLDAVGAAATGRGERAYDIYSRLLRERLGGEKGAIDTTFQSGLGPEEWLKPYPGEHEAELAKAPAGV